MEKSEGENKEKQRRWNPETLKLLEEKGADLNKLHKIINVFNLFDEEGIQTLSRLLEETEFRVVDVIKMDKSDKSTYWSLDAEVELIPDLERINQMTDSCIDLAASVNAADYDGWYTQPED